VNYVHNIIHNIVHNIALCRPVMRILFFKSYQSIVVVVLLFSRVCADATKSLITAIIVGQDAVSRTGARQLERFRKMLIQVMTSCPHTKVRIINLY